MNWKFDFSPETSAVMRQCLVSIQKISLYGSETCDNLHMMGSALGC